MTQARDDGAVIRLSDEQRLDWLRLIRSENVGPVTFRELINHFGSAQDALEALPELSRRGGKGAINVCARADAEREMEEIESGGARLIALGEQDYPPNLRYVDGPPPLLTILSNSKILRKPQTIAIVGARNCSLAGQKLTTSFARDFGAADYSVVSGLARGIDTAAHKASIDTGTIAVMAGGVNIIYPPENASLRSAILDGGGAVITEMPLGWRPRARDFPRRNRLISGVSQGVLLVEAARASGSLHTARFALEQNRDVFVIPGSPLDPRSEGGNRLIQQGAALVNCAKDVLSGLKEFQQPSLNYISANEADANHFPPKEIDDSDRHKILTALSATPSEIDDLIRFTGLPARNVQVILLELELAGRLERHAGHKVALLI